MNPAERRRLLKWLEAEERESQRLPDLLAQLAEEDKVLRPLARFLAIKDAEERARITVLDRARWYRSLSWRLTGYLFGIGAAGTFLFILWGGESAFMASIFFFLGCASFYLLAQATTTARSRRDQKALEKIHERSRQELADLRREIGT